MLRIYLAGHTLHTFYREHVKRKYKRYFDLVDPIEKEGTQVDVINKIVTNTIPIEDLIKSDKLWIEHGTDILVAYIEKATFGTSMEILHAWNNKIPIYVILPPESRDLKDDYWLSYHATKFFSGRTREKAIDECFRTIMSLVDDLKLIAKRS